MQDKMKKVLSEVEFRASPDGGPVPKDTLLSDYIKGPESELFIFYGTFSLI